MGYRTVHEIGFELLRLEECPVGDWTSRPVPYRLPSSTVLYSLFHRGVSYRCLTFGYRVVHPSTTYRCAHSFHAVGSGLNLVQPSRLNIVHLVIVRTCCTVLRAWVSRRRRLRGSYRGGK